MDIWDWEFSCPKCDEERIVPAAGPKSSPVLIIGAFPGVEEIRTGKPMSGKSGSILTKELSIDFHRVRRVNLWHHPPNESEECLEHGEAQVIQEAKGKKVILLIGAEPAKHFTGYNVSEVNGIIVQANFLSCKRIYASIQPVSVFKRGGIGEVKFALGRFSKEAEKWL